MCFYSDDWNLGNCYKYLNRYLSTKGEKKGDIKSLYKTCHYIWLEYNKMITTDFEAFKKEINDVEKFNPSMFKFTEVDSDLVQIFKDDNMQVTDLFWAESQYFRLATLLIQQHENEYINLETT
jgi:hypothetical protein